MKGIDPKWIFFLGIGVTIETAIGHGSVSLTNVVPESWAPYIVGWCSLLAFIGNVVMTAFAGFSSASPGMFTATLPVSQAQRGPSPPLQPGGGAAAVLLAIGITFVLMTSVWAQTPRAKPALTGDVLKDLKTDFAQAPVDANGNPVCNLKVFLQTNPETLREQVKKCIAQDATKTWVPDFQAALKSAQDAKNQVGINCLTPATAIVAAIAGTPGVPANPNATPPTPEILGTTAGPVTLFEKVSEFAQAGGPSACKALVNTTAQMLLTP